MFRRLASLCVVAVVCSAYGSVAAVVRAYVLPRWSMHRCVCGVHEVCPEERVCVHCFVLPAVAAVGNKAEVRGAITEKGYRCQHIERVPVNQEAAQQ